MRMRARVIRCRRSARTLALHGGQKQIRMSVAGIRPGSSAAAAAAAVAALGQRSAAGNGRRGLTGMIRHGRTGRRRIVRVGPFVGRSFEKVVLQGVVGRDAALGLVVQHAQDQILEFQVVGHKVTHFARSTSARSARFHSCKKKHKKISKKKNFFFFFELN